MTIPAPQAKRDTQAYLLGTRQFGKQVREHSQILDQDFRPFPPPFVTTPPSAPAEALSGGFVPMQGVLTLTYEYHCTSFRMNNIHAKFKLPILKTIKVFKRGEP